MNEDTWTKKQEKRNMKAQKKNLYNLKFEKEAYLIILEVILIKIIFNL